MSELCGRFAVIACVLLVTGCEMEGEALDEPFTLTVAIQQEDGSWAQTQQIITRRQQLAHQASRASSLGESATPLSALPSTYDANLFVMTNCGLRDGSISMYDRRELSGNQLCLRLNSAGGTGSIGLIKFKRKVECNSVGCLQYFWNDAVRSYAAGSQSGWFDHGSSHGVHFSSYDTVLNYYGSADVLELTSAP